MKESLDPIRYIAEKAGVKTITLGLWEKRYNLIKPKQTDKEHCLYSNEDIRTIQKAITLINHGYSIREVPNVLNDYNGYIFSTDRSVNQLISFDKLNNLIKDSKISAAIKEIEDLMALYSPELYAQIIHPAMMQSLNKDSFIHICYQEIIKEKIIDSIIFRLYRNILKKSEKKHNEVYIIGYRTSMIKHLVLHGLFIANILSAHGYSIFFCSGVSSLDSVIELPSDSIKIVYTRYDDFYLSQLNTKCSLKSHNLILSVYKSDINLSNIYTLPSNYSRVFNAFLEFASSLDKKDRRI